MDMFTCHLIWPYHPELDETFMPKEQGSSGEELAKSINAKKEKIESFFHFVEISSVKQVASWNAVTNTLSIVCI
jgi:hypothetical protein